MGYKYEVFLSYRRHKEWPKWLEYIFLPIFEHWLGEELGYNAEISWDNTIETGVAWPYDLSQKLAQSKILVPLFSRQYFNSNWCITELSLMLAREKECGLCTIKCPGGLIVPAVIHDGNDFPDIVNMVQAAKLQKFTNIRMASDSPTYEKLSELIRDWVPDVAKAIKRAPKYDPKWQDIAVKKLLKQFTIKQQKQKKPSLI